jgi:group I intron endonuclease
MKDGIYQIYVIVNLKNGKGYVGITSRRLLDRVAEHVARAKSGCRNNRLAVAMRKYGFDSFGAFVEITCNSEGAARKLETATIIKYNTYKDGYNCNLGGHGNLNVSEESKRSRSEKQKGKVIPFESRVKMSLAKLGNKDCANNLGKFAQKGYSNNGNAKVYEVKYPDGHIETILNLTKFCKVQGLPSSAARHLAGRGRSHGYEVLRRFDGHPEREYAQAGRSGGYPIADESLL